MTIFMRSRLRLLLNTRNLQTQYPTQLFFQWCGSQTAWWLQLSLSATSPGPWRRVSCKAYLPTSWGMWHSHDGYRLTHYDWWGPSVVPITMVDFAVAEPNQAIQLGELWFGCWVHSWCWNGVINLDIDYGPSIGTTIYITHRFFLRTPQTVDADRHKVLQHSNNPLQVWKVDKSWRSWLLDFPVHRSDCAKGTKQQCASGNPW